MWRTTVPAGATCDFGSTHNNELVQPLDRRALSNGTFEEYPAQVGTTGDYSSVGTGEFQWSTPGAVVTGATSEEENINNQIASSPIRGAYRGIHSFGVPLKLTTGNTDDTSSMIQTLFTAIVQPIDHPEAVLRVDHLRQIVDYIFEHVLEVSENQLPKNLWMAHFDRVVRASGDTPQKPNNVHESREFLGRRNP